MTMRSTAKARSLRELHIELACLVAQRVDPDRLRDRGRERRAGPQRELSLVQRALDAAVLDVALGEQRVLVRADVVDRVERAAALADGNLAIADAHADDLFVAERRGLRHFMPRHAPSSRAGKCSALYCSVHPLFPRRAVRRPARARRMIAACATTGCPGCSS